MAKKIDCNYWVIFNFNFALIPIKDATNCFKMFKKSMIDQISISSKIGFLYAFEITVKAYLNDNKIVEIPYTWMMDNKKKVTLKPYNGCQVI